MDKLLMLYQVLGELIQNLLQPRGNWYRKHGKSLNQYIYKGPYWKIPIKIRNLFLIWKLDFWIMNKFSGGEFLNSNEVAENTPRYNAQSSIKTWVIRYNNQDPIIYLNIVNVRLFPIKSIKKWSNIQETCIC